MLPPNSVLYIGCVGADAAADTLRASCAAAGVRAEYLVDAVQATGRCGVVVTGHSRSMVTDLAAANEYKEAHLRSEPVWALVRRAAVYFVGGYHLTVCPAAVMALAAEAARADKAFALSLSAPFIAQFFADPLDATAPYWDYVVGNEAEAEAWAAGHGVDGADLEGVVRALAELEKVNKARKRVAIVTQGTGDTLVAVQGEKSVRRFPVHAIGGEEINDTTGAG
jgi:adenosine kinase